MFQLAKFIFLLAVYLGLIFAALQILGAALGALIEALLVPFKWADSILVHIKGYEDNVQPFVPIIVIVSTVILLLYFASH